MERLLLEWNVSRGGGSASSERVARLQHREVFKRQREVSNDSTETYDYRKEIYSTCKYTCIALKKILTIERMVHH